jgi:hypothetical protein
MPHQVPAWPSGLDQQGREPLHPAVDADVIDLDAPLGEQLLDVAVGQAEAQLPADRDDDDIGWEPEAGEVRPWNQSRARTARSHAASLAAPRRSQRTQQRRLDHYEVRRWPGWYRHVTLALLAHAFLVVTRTTATSDLAKGDAAA